MCLQENVHLCWIVFEATSDNLKRGSDLCTLEVIVIYLLAVDGSLQK
jgi:hypothetical protein